MECIINGPKNYSCIICHRPVHHGNYGCCSTFRIDVFAWAALCLNCAAIYDRLMVDEELQKVLKYLLNKEYWKDRVVTDF